MRDIVITAGTAIGSVISLAESITNEIGCKAYVICTHEPTCKVLRRSNYIHEVVHIRSVNETAYIHDVKAWYSNHSFIRKPILYSTTDTSCFYISKHREWFEEKFEVCLPSSDIIFNFTKKGEAEPIAVEAGLSVPRTTTLESFNDIEFVINSFKFPVIVKPAATYTKSNLDFKIKVFDDKDLFKKFAISIQSISSLICQEYIPGGNESSYFYLFYRDKKGAISEVMGNKTIQSTVNGGIMLKGTTYYDKELSSLSKNFLNNIGYYGIGGIEFKKYNNTFYFIEMSVRLEGFFKISEIAGVRLALHSYYDLLDPPMLIDKSKRQEDGYVYVDLIGLTLFYIKQRNFLDIPKELARLKSNPKVHSNILNLRNSTVFLSQLSYVLKSSILKLK